MHRNGGKTIWRWTDTETQQESRAIPGQGPSARGSLLTNTESRAAPLRKTEPPGRGPLSPVLPEEGRGGPWAQGHGSQGPGSEQLAFWRQRSGPEVPHRTSRQSPHSSLLESKAPVEEAMSKGPLCGLGPETLPGPSFPVGSLLLTKGSSSMPKLQAPPGPPEAGSKGPQERGRLGLSIRGPRPEAWGRWLSGGQGSSPPNKAPRPNVLWGWGLNGSLRT